MARPIPFHAPAFDSRAALRTKVEQASAEHAEAVLAAYDLLQVLHDRGVLDTVTSALRAGDELLEQAVDAANTPAAIRALRNLAFLATPAAEPQQPVTIWRLVRRALSRDTLRGLAAAVDFLASFGRHLRAMDASSSAGSEKERAQT
jgi:uncharacterized protein YjgD (DUF1641 family)